MPVSRLISVCAASLALALTPAAASAGTDHGTISGVESGWDACASPCALVLPDVVQAAGVLTRVVWPATGTASSDFVALRPSGDGWTQIKSLTPPVGVNTIEEGREQWGRVPVQPGDRIGVVRQSGGVLSKGTLEGTAVEGGAFVKSGDSWTQVAGPARAPRLQMRIEPDVDGDGYGDESQDACLGAAGARCEGSELAVVELSPQTAPFGPAVEQRWQVTNIGTQPVDVMAAIPSIDPNTLRGNPTVSIDGIWCPPTPAADFSTVLSQQLRIREGTEGQPPRWRIYDGERYWRPKAGTSLPVCGARAIGGGESAIVTLRVPELTLEGLASQPTFTELVAGPISTNFRLWATTGIPPGGSRSTIYTRTNRAYERNAYSPVWIERRLRKRKLEVYAGCSKALIEGTCEVRLVLSEPKGKSGASVRKQGRAFEERTLLLKAGQERKLRIALPRRLTKSRTVRVHWRTETQLSTLPDVVFRLKSGSPRKVKVR